MSDSFLILAEDELENWRSQFATPSEIALRSQFSTLKRGRGQHRKYLPYVFTVQGVAMLSTVLKSETPVKVQLVTDCDRFASLKHSTSLPLDCRGWSWATACCSKQRPGRQTVCIMLAKVNVDG